MNRNPISDFKEDILEYGGDILWENTFDSWTPDSQQEIIARLWSFIIYAQTKQNYLQPCWIAFEHEVSMSIQNFSQFSRHTFIKRSGQYVHTVMQFDASYMFRLLRIMKNNIKINPLFQEVPNYRLFHFLNHMEVQYYEKDEEKVIKIVLDKMRKSHLGNFVSTVRFIPKPVYYNI